MKKLVFSLAVFATFGFADLFDEGFEAYKNGDYQKAVNLLQKSCDGGFAMGCNNLGSMYYNGHGTRQNKSVAKEFYGKACDLGNQVGCESYKILNEQGVR